MGGDDLLVVVIVGCEGIEVAGIGVGSESNQSVLGRGGMANALKGFWLVVVPLIVLLLMLFCWIIIVVGCPGGLGKWLSSVV